MGKTYGFPTKEVWYVNKALGYSVYSIW